MPAPIAIITAPQPAFLGLNKERQQVPQAPSWCIEAQNAVIDGAGRLAARKGRDTLTTSAVESGAAIRSVFEYVQTDGDVFIVSATATNIYSGTTTLSSIKGSITQTAGRWQFVNFNGSVYGWQKSHTPIVWAGTSNFAHLTASSGTLPDGDCVAAAFGRLWGLDDDGQTIRYCGLLTPTLWDTADGGGVIDMRSVWTRGTDRVQAIIAYGSRLVVFGIRHIILWSDGQGSDIGIDPLTMYVEQSIEGVGTIARDSVQQVGELDIMFWSESGVRSLRRALSEKPTPLNDASGNVRTFLEGVKATANTDNVRSVYSPVQGLYLLCVPDSDVTMCFDTKFEMEQGALRTSEWSGFDATAACVRLDGTILFGGAGELQRYFGYDDDGESYRFAYRMPWLAGAPDQSGNPAIANRLNHLKEIGAIVMAPDNTPIVFKWWTDFKNNVHTVNKTVEGGAFAEYNADALYTVAEYSGDITVKDLRITCESGAEHKFLSVGIEVDIDGFPFAIQSVTTVVRPGRPA